MQKLRLVLLIWALVIITTVTTREWIGVTSTVTHKLAKAINKFALRLYMQLPKNENHLISPLSISVAMGMVYLGAKHETAQEMELALGYNDEQLYNGDIHKGFQNILHNIERSKEGYELIVANSMFYQSDSLILNCYKKTLEEIYKAEITETDFANNGEKSVNEINSWVDKNTHHEIKQLFESPLSSDTRLVLVNAVYFQGAWVSEFLLKEGTFYNNGQNPKSVPLMYLRHEVPFAYIEDLDAKVIELPYNGTYISMFVILPVMKDGILNLERRLSSKILEQVTEKLTKTTVDVTLPKFTLSYKKELSETLQSLGLLSLFSEEKADLSGINGGRDMFVSHVKHHATIEVNEKGSMATAATGVGIIGFTYQPNFYAHHPFFFFIKDKRTGIILFTGCVNEL
ncbi:serpin B3-like isoform X2 [Limulus polyphemus]|nr:serpin B3-like isoform X2 [Limulus polyphemus]XP_013779217.1 serpin B3-like isoform X2 [Limulus polyphemus]XP_013779220.1 serpin B3-like isoform X2 [Limulus polyphemus]XP_022246986.1 serpin B3-like isoform X2 [Limulus polyphemus]XP_022246987.1 serpin B3-like isoform X2 [Limulus polyphemus]XP_022246988.1 serpin B3-like isoform X2 [Limulus polyphemus]XP_022246989.1 serpin B3-like isoform X2 [Limulus polyphemus]XP_022246990.1 serpin B3-like isoform X2 [Limulus polyphemus]XP_022246991.1 serp